MLKMSEVETIRRGLDATVRGARIESVRIVRASGLPNRTDSMFTTIEGEWGEIFDVSHRATEAVSAYGRRVDLVIRADIRPGHDHELTRKMESLEKAIADQSKVSGPKSCFGPPARARETAQRCDRDKRRFSADRYWTSATFLANCPPP